MATSDFSLAFVHFGDRISELSFYYITKYILIIVIVFFIGFIVIFICIIIMCPGKCLVVN